MFSGGLQPLDLREIEDAMRTVRQVSDGQARPQIRRRLIEDLETRGVILPPPMVDGFTDQIVMLGAGLTGRVQHEARRIGLLAEAAAFGVQLLRAARQHRPVPRMETSGMRSARLDPRHIREPVKLDPEAQAVLDIDTHNPISVWLDFAGPGPHDDADMTAPAAVTDAPVVIFLGDYRLAELGAEASQRYRQAVKEAREAGVIIVVPALRDLAEDGSWRLYVPWPRIESSPDPAQPRSSCN